MAAPRLLCGRAPPSRQYPLGPRAIGWKGGNDVTAMAPQHRRQADNAGAMARSPHCVSASPQSHCYRSRAIGIGCREKELADAEF